MAEYSWFYFNGHRSTDFGLAISDRPDYVTAQPDTETVTIPGRNGTLTRKLGTYKTRKMVYNCWFFAIGDVVEQSRRIAEWLQEPTQKTQLYDSYDPDYFSMAICTNAVTVSNRLNRTGRVKIEFECQPERFLTQYNEWQTLSGTTSITNPYETAKPIIKLPTAHESQTLTVTGAGPNTAVVLFTYNIPVGRNFGLRIHYENQTAQLPNFQVILKTEQVNDQYGQQWSWGYALWDSPTSWDSGVIDAFDRGGGAFISKNANQTVLIMYYGEQGESMTCTVEVIGGGQTELTIGDKTITASPGLDDIFIDTETQNIYDAQGRNANQGARITYTATGETAYSMPDLPARSTTDITVPSGTAEAKLRFWRL